MFAPSRLIMVGLLLCMAAPLTAQNSRYASVAQNGKGSWSFEKDGRRFFSMGVCHIAPKNEGSGKIYDGVKARGSLAKWSDSVVQRLTAAGFNTAGAWCDEAIYAKPLPATRYLWLGMEVDGIKQRLLNVFSPGYEAAVDNLCREFVEPRKSDPWLVGWFLDNELPWYGEFGWQADGQKSLLDQALGLAANDPNRQQALLFLEEHYQTFDRFQAEWESAATSWKTLVAAPRAKNRRADVAKYAWAGRVADRFYSVAVAAVRKYDKNHLILGSRFAGNAPGPVIAACARHCDVISINRYVKDGTVDVDWWDRLYAIVQKPILVTEFSFRAMENRTGNKNRRGADVTVATQQDRANRYSAFVSAMMTRPYIIGMHWFEWADQPENGRALDGEDSNYGLVDWEDREYAELMAAAKATHAGLPSPNARTGTLPAAADRQGKEWSAPPLATFAEGTLSSSAELLGPAQPYLSLDRNAGSKASPTADGQKWRIEYDSGTGWGFSSAWVVSREKNLVGAKKVKLIASGPAGIKLCIAFNELGHDKQPVPDGIADGESWTLPVQELGSGEVIFDLSLAEVNAYYGNQKGNRRLDLAGLADVAVVVPGNQGAGTLTISSVFNRIS